MELVSIEENSPLSGRFSINCSYIKDLKPKQITLNFSLKDSFGFVSQSLEVYTLAVGAKD